MRDKYQHFLYLSVFAVTLFASCGNVIKEPTDMKFAITGNTFPESPFKGLNPNVKPVLDKINEENPVFIVHVGDIVHGGRSWMGIKKSDMSRQFSDFFTLASNLRPILFTVKGEYDMLENSHEQYVSFSGRKSRYSFNYGKNHMVVLDTAAGKTAGMEQDQLDWLEKDLRLHVKSPAIFIFTHNPLFTREAPDNDENPVCMERDKLHEIFVRHRVRAVFSGHVQYFYTENRDGIEYVTAGCAHNCCLEKNRKNDSCASYYMVDYIKGDLKITHGKPCDTAGAKRK
jgi:hypothetical protein